MKKLQTLLKGSLYLTVNRILLIGFIGLSLGGCHAVLLGSAAVAGYEVAKDERSASEVATDTRIVADIKQKLLRDRLISGWDVNVDSHKGEVTLHGNVSSQTAKERALLIAQSIKGVTKITSKLIIIPNSSE